MLETIRAYARERLAANVEEPELRRRHVFFILDFVEDAAREIGQGGDYAVMLARLGAEDDNIRAALEWATRIARRRGVDASCGSGRLLLAIQVSQPGGGALDGARAGAGALPGKCADACPQDGLHLGGHPGGLGALGCSG